MTDQVLYWNSVALDANRISHTEGGEKHPGVNGPTLSSRALAIVHLAMYDAYVGVARAKGITTLTNYLTGLSVPSSTASEHVAIATAAHATLSKLYPNMKPYFDEKQINANLNNNGYDEGYDFGMEVARKIWRLRADDPTDSDDGFALSLGRGRYRHDPLNSNPVNAPFYGSKSVPFAATNRWGIKSPPALSSQDYKDAVKQVRGKGIRPELMGTLPSTYSKRTVDETLIGIYWAYDGAKNLGTPPRFYNQIVRQIAVNHGNTLEQNVQLFALINVAMGDAGILAWDQKYIHNFWRPVTGIREHDASMGPAFQIGKDNINNDCDPLWLPLGAPKTNEDANDFTPPFPAYPSGHATFGAAALHITRLFYGIPIGNRSADNISNTVTNVPAGGITNETSYVSEEFNGINKDANGSFRPKHFRQFDDGLWQMIKENGLSRVYLGVHWSFDAFDLDSNNNPNIVTNTANPDDVGIGGVPLGIVIAEDLFQNGLKISTVPPRT